MSVRFSLSTSIALLLGTLSFGLLSNSVVGQLQAAPPHFIRGDTNLDGNVALPDVITLLNGLFVPGNDLPCDNAGDLNDDGALGLPDAIVLLNHLFLGGAAPVNPFPNCGLDLTGSSLPCNSGVLCTPATEIARLILEANGVIAVDTAGNAAYRVAPEAGYVGFSRAAWNPAGSRFYALAADQNIVYEFDLDGAETAALVVPAGTARGLAVASTGIIYVSSTDVTTVIYEIEPTNGVTAPLTDLGNVEDLQSMTVDSAGRVFATIQGGVGGDRILIIENGFTTVFADTSESVDTPTGITFAAGVLYSLNDRPGTTAQLLFWDFGAGSGVFGTVGGYIDPDVRGIAVTDSGEVLVTHGLLQKIVEVAPPGVALNRYMNLCNPVDIVERP